MTRLVAIVGPPGSGKTTVCERIAEAARSKGLRVAGIISPGAPGDPSGRDRRLVVNLATGERRDLGRRAATRAGERRWELDERALAWGEKAAIDGAHGAEVLVIDEIGRLELLEGRGWSACVELLRDATPALAVASVREELVEAFRRRLGEAAGRLEVFRVSESSLVWLAAELLREPR